MNKLLKDAIVFNNQESMQLLSKFIALYVRNHLEDLHANDAVMNDDTMPAINTAIRNGIYNALYIISNSNNNIENLEVASMTFNKIPNYWEQPKLDIFLENDFQNINLKPIKFNSSFLNEQIINNNICQLPNSLLVCICVGFDNDDLSSDQRKKLVNKIRAELKKEGYIYDLCSDAYSKKIKMHSFE